MCEVCDNVFTIFCDRNQESIEGILIVDNRGLDCTKVHSTAYLQHKHLHNLAPQRSASTVHEKAYLFCIISYLALVFVVDYCIQLVKKYYVIPVSDLDCVQFGPQFDNQEYKEICFRFMCLSIEELFVSQLDVYDEHHEFMT